MQFFRNSLLARSDTMFGICQALGEDLGISPTWFRVGVAALVIFNIKAAIAIYAGLGLLVLVSRLLYPNRAAATETLEAAAPAPAAEAQPVPEAAPAPSAGIAQAA
ncbi:MAG TPA: PspC domain-containing protein [Sphingobium sp.]|nr:PspC domain-containing protein [Sphingobium sp.]